MCQVDPFGWTVRMSSSHSRIPHSTGRCPLPHMQAAVSSNYRPTSSRLFWSFWVPQSSLPMLHNPLRVNLPPSWASVTGRAISLTWAAYINGASVWHLFAAGSTVNST